MSDYKLEVFYDGQCPVCTREIGFLQRRDKHKRVRFTDIAAPDFDASDFGIAWTDFMDRIHARLPDGSWIQGVEVFRQLYAAVGLGWLLAPTRLPGIRQIADFAYARFAANRLRLTGRCDPDGCAIEPATSK